MDLRKAPDRFPARSGAGRKPSPWRGGSIYLVRLGGVPVYLHFTFLILLAYVAYFHSGGFVLVLATFGSVALHELGHAMMARQFGIKTEDIVLYPIGGVARLRSMGMGWQEFWIALAGPAVNLAIFVAIVAVLLSMAAWMPVREWAESSKAMLAWLGGSALWLDDFLKNVAFINMGLLVFNLMPAFPMDGGRVLRSVLAMVLPRIDATRIASWIGQGFAAIFLIVGIMWNPILALIGIFIFLAARQEVVAAKSAEFLSGRRACDAMATQFTTLTHGETIGRAADLASQTGQLDFPVAGGNEIIGLLDRRDLAEGLTKLGREHFVAEAMRREFPRTRPEDPLELAMALMQRAEGLPVMVFDRGRLVGYINQETLVQHLLAAQAQTSKG
jgi:Zn-dependent protease